MSGGRPDNWQRWCDAQGVDINSLTSRLEQESSALAYQAAIEGQGVALARRELVKQELEDATLIEMENGQLDCGSLTYYLVWHTGSLKEPALRCFQEWLTGGP